MEDHHLCAQLLESLVAIIKLALSLGVLVVARKEFQDFMPTWPYSELGSTNK